MTVAADPATIHVHVDADGTHTGQVIITHPPGADRVVVLCPLGHYWTSGELGAMHGAGEWIHSRAQYPWIVTCHGALPTDLQPEGRS